MLNASRAKVISAALAVAVLAAVAVVAFLSMTGSPGSNEARPAPSPLATVPVSPEASPPATSGSGSSTPGASGQATPPDAAAGGSQTGSGEASSAGSPGSTPMPGSTPTPGSTPMPGSTPTPTYAMVHSPLSGVASAVGAVVAGFPSTFVPIPDGATVVITTVTSEGSIMQAGLEAKSTATVDEIVAFYRHDLDAQGFTASPAAALGPGQAWHFLRDGEGVALTVRTASDGGTSFSVAGTFVAVG